jgi:hypothetical protein
VSHVYVLTIALHGEEMVSGVFSTLDKAKGHVHSHAHPKTEKPLEWYHDDPDDGFGRDPHMTWALCREYKYRIFTRQVDQWAR